MFRSGQEIECIKDIDLKATSLWMQSQVHGHKMPVVGDKFTVRWCGERIGDNGLVAVLLNELQLPTIRDTEIAFDSRYFRAILKTDISVLLKLCHPTPVKALELV